MLSSSRRVLRGGSCSTAACSRPRHCAVVLRAAAVRTQNAATAVSTADITAQQVSQLLDALTAPQMEIAEFHLVSGDVEITVRRNLADAAPAAAPAAPTPAAATLAPQPHMSPALRLAPAPLASMDEYGPEDSIDESLLFVTANRVGIFRRGKSKAKVGDQVKRGEVLGAIEQLGTVVDVKAPQDGEIVGFKAKDGDPVEFGGHLVSLAPYFNLEDAGKTSARGLI